MTRKKTAKRALFVLIIGFFAVFLLAMGSYYLAPEVSLSPGADAGMIAANFFMILFIAALLIILSIIFLLIYLITHTH